MRQDLNTKDIGKSGQAVRCSQMQCKEDEIKHLLPLKMRAVYAHK